VVQNVITTPGLHFKTPFVESVNRLENRLLRFDATPSEFLTGEKKALVINSYARYRILDAQQFFEVVRTEAQARARLEAIISSEIRAEVATHDQIEVIRDRREELMLDVTQRSDIQAREFGITVVDVRIVGADFPTEVANSVYARMQSERIRIANRFRAEGEEERATVEAGANLESRTILASAEERAATVRGEGEAEAIQILGEAINLDVEFFTFVRTLEAYVEAMGTGTTLVIPADSDFYQFITDPYPVGSAEREDV
jgi:membrane protease subunit HflC